MGGDRGVCSVEPGAQSQTEPDDGAQLGSTSSGNFDKRPWNIASMVATVNFLKSSQIQQRDESKSFKIKKITVSHVDISGSETMVHVLLVAHGLLSVEIKLWLG